MDLKQLLKDDDAVSPAIGVILMVAITVILAAVIASFVLGLGNQTSQGAPTASFSDEYNSIPSHGGSGYVKISHDSGDTISNQTLYIRGSGFNNSRDASDVSLVYKEFKEQGQTIALDVNDSSAWPADEASGQDSAVASGDTVNVPVDSDYELSVVYQSQEGDTSSTLYEASGPNA